MSEPEAKVRICPMKFAMSKDSPIPDYNCEGPLCAWWLKNVDDRGWDLSHCAITDLGWLANTGRTP